MRPRGTPSNPPNRFEPRRTEIDADFAPSEAELPGVELIRDPSRSIVATNDSPDVGFDASVNPYRGCSHACPYCFARPFHEYLGWSAGLDFETKILFKPEAPALLRRKLASPSWRPRTLALSGVTDCYQPAERGLRITRGCLAVLAEFRNPATIVTKGWGVVRDVDLLAELAAHDAASVLISVTSLDRDFQRVMEPGASPPAKRLEAIETLARAGVPVGVLVAPVVPAINDHEIPRILEAVASAGAGWASKVMLRLPHGVGPLFEEWLERHFPERRKKVLSKVRSMRGGELYDARYGKRQRGEGVYADHTQALFDLALRRHGLADRGPDLSVAAFRRPGGQQLGLHL
ncbi:MAG TPA: PA0069 family radical SAM protein [Myxococcota bacterium]|nr:PA0069 family radical SAM protein [Myxococcota bacterium]